MRFIVSFLLLICLSGCVNFTEFDRKKERLQNDIQILKLEVRKEKLENELERLESE